MASSEITSLVRYYKGANYAAGATTFRIDGIKTRATYRTLVECPSTDDFMDTVTKETAYRCDGGSGNNLKAEEGKMYNIVKDWGGWSEGQRKALDPSGFYQCVYARDGRAHGCLSYDVMHCLHLKPRHGIPSMIIATRTDTKVETVWNGKVFGNSVNVPLHSGKKVLVTAVINSDWPNHAIINNNKMYLDEELRASVYAAAMCPIYKKGDKWLINNQVIKANYYPEVGWVIDADWEGQPRGRTLDASSNEGNNTIMEYDMQEGLLEVTADTAIVQIPDKDILDDCTISFCKAVNNVNTGVSIDIISGHKGRFLSVLAKGGEGAHCRITDEDHTEHIVPNAKAFIITTMAYQLETKAGKYECPKPTDAEYDQMYGYEVHGHVSDKVYNPSIMDAITGIHLPVINTKYILFAASAGVVILTQFNQLGVILAAGIALVAVTQPAAAMTIATEQAIDNAIDVILVAHHIKTGPWIWISLAILMPFSISPKTDMESGKRMASAAWVYLMHIGNDPMMAVLAWLILMLMRGEPAKVAIYNAIINAKNEAERFATNVDPYMQPIKLKVHSMWSSYHIVADERGSKPYLYVERPAPDSNETVDVELVGDRMVISGPFSRLPKEKKMMAKRRKGVKAMRGFVLYDEEFDYLERYLKQLDPVSISRIYAGAIRIHGRQLWELKSLTSRVSSIRLRREMESMLYDDFG